MKFFFDNHFSPKLTEFLNKLAVEDKHEIVHLRDKFAEDTPDKDWITGLAGEGGWIIITADIRIRKNPAERAALESSGLTWFFFPKGFMGIDRWEQSWRTIKIFPDIIKCSEKYPTRYIIEVLGSWKLPK